MGRYHTKQQAGILEYLSRQGDVPFTADEVWHGLLASGGEVGQATVYRALDRLAADGLVIKVPAAEGKRARYRYVGSSAPPSSGRMVCLGCGQTFPLECSHLEELTHHIQSDHHFELDARHTVLYGRCQGCAKRS